MHVILGCVFNAIGVRYSNTVFLCRGAIRFGALAAQLVKVLLCVRTDLLDGFGSNGFLDFLPRTRDWLQRLDEACVFILSPVLSFGRPNSFGNGSRSRAIRLMQTTRIRLRNRKLTEAQQERAMACHLTEDIIVPTILLTKKGVRSTHF